MSDLYHYQHGLTCRDGITSAFIAQSGINGLYDMLDGENGYWVSVSDQCDWDWMTRGLGKAWLKDPRSHLSSVEVVAKGRTISREKLWEKGDYHTEEARMTDAELEGKFRTNASRIISKKNIDKKVQWQCG